MTEAVGAAIRKAGSVLVSVPVIIVMTVIKSQADGHTDMHSAHKKDRILTDDHD